jgi:hypothetical protein
MLTIPQDQDISQAVAVDEPKKMVHIAFQQNFHVFM